MSLNKAQVRKLLEDHVRDGEICLRSRQDFLISLSSLSYLNDRGKGLFKSLARCGSVNTVWLDDRRLMDQSNLVVFNKTQELASLKSDVQTELDLKFPWPTPSKVLLDGLDALDC